MNYDTEKIWEDFGAVIRAFIQRRVSNTENIDDILQEVFLKIHSNIDTLEDNRKIRSWVYQITRNTIIDYYRKHKYKLEDIDNIPLEDEVVFESEEITTEESPNQEIASGLKDMVEALPKKYAEALLLVEFHGLSQVELAKKLGISISGAKSRVQRGRLLLRDSLMKCCHFEFDKYGTIIDFHSACCCCCHLSHN